MKELSKLRRLAVAQSKLRLMEATATVTALRDYDESAAEEARRVRNADGEIWAANASVIFAISSSKYIYQQIEKNRAVLNDQIERRVGAERRERQIEMALAARVEQKRIEFERQQLMDFICDIRFGRDEVDAS